MRSEDAKLIRSFLAGKRHAVARIDGWLVGAASPYQRRLGEGWDDVLQDLRLEVTRLLREERFRGEASLRTYLSRVASHACLNRIRSQERWQWEEVDDARPDPAGGGAEARVSRDLLLRILGRTPAECRRLWTMILEGYDYKEMSERLGVKAGALRVRVLRCRRQAVDLRDQLLSEPAMVTPPPPGLPVSRRG